jgi:hypothetical protein
MIRCFTTSRAMWAHLTCVGAVFLLAQSAFGGIGASTLGAATSGQSIFGAAAIGPIDAISKGANGTELTVLGQQFKAASGELSGYRVGQYVLAAADRKGQLSVLLSLDDNYVPGSSTVWLKGSVTSVSPAIGKFAVGGVSLDYSAYLSTDPEFSVQVGDTVEAYGIQPQPGGSVLLGIHGGGLQGIHGGGLQGIHGGGLQGIHGGGLQGIHGGGLQGIHGGGLQGIHGGGLQGIHGGGLQGIHGGGLQGIHGGGLQGIHGGGLQGIHGGGLQGIHGGGLQGIHGGGLQGIHGGGLQGIHGGGLQGIHGGGTT